MLINIPKIPSNSPHTFLRQLIAVFAIFLTACSQTPQPTPFDLKSGKHFHSVVAIGVSNDSERIISIDTGGTILIWDSSTGNQVGSKSFRVPLAMSANGKVVLGALRSGVRIVDTDSGRDSEYLIGEIKTPYQAFLSANGELALLIDFDGTQSLVNTSSGEVLHSPFAYSYGRGYATLFSPAFSHDGTKILIASRRKPGFDIWDVETGIKLLSISAHRSGIRATTFSQDASEVLTVGMDNSLKRWNAESGKLLDVYETSNLALITRVVVSPNSRMIYTGHADGSILIWNITGEVVSQFLAHEGWVESLEVSRDGRSLVSSGPDKLVKIWDLETEGPS